MIMFFPGCGPALLSWAFHVNEYTDIYLQIQSCRIHIAVRIFPLFSGMFQTQQFKLSRADYFGIFVRYRLRRMWLVYLIILVLAVINLLNYPNITSILTVCVFAVLYTGMFLLQSWLQSYRSRNNLLFETRYVTIEQHKLRVTTVADTVFDTPVINEVPLTSIYKVKREGQYFLLFIGRNQFIIVPRKAFGSEQEEKEFLSALA